jgi:hypothetical protein
MVCAITKGNFLKWNKLCPRRVGSVECKLFKEDNRGDVAI